MGKIGLIISREYLTRVKSRPFIVMTVLGPLLWLGLIAGQMLIAHSSDAKRKIIVVDETYMYHKLLANSEKATFDYSFYDMKLEVVQELFKDSDNISVLYIPPNLTQNAYKVKLFSKTQPSGSLIGYISNQLSGELLKRELIANKIDPELVNNAKVNVNVLNIINNQESDTTIYYVLGFGAALIIYMFIFIYSVQVMRGVMEEKSSRIVEVIISSVKPFQLMMGKIIGLGMVGLTQFLIWIITSSIIFVGVSNYFYGKQINVQQSVEQMKSTEFKSGANVSDRLSYQKSNREKSEIENTLENIKRVNWALVIPCFIFYFLCGYLLYSALFAAIGAAVDSETDTQQFILPLTIPLIMTISSANSLLQNPDGPVAFWFSIIPFTSPIAMMIRIAFGIPADHIWELVLSMILLVGGFIFTTWIAGKIYRTGILMYGKKISYKEISKWLFYK